MLKNDVRECMDKLKLLDCQKLIYIESNKLERMQAYNSCYHFRLKGVVDVAILRQAIRVLVLKYDAFSLRFKELDDGTVIQQARVLDDVTMSVVRLKKLSSQGYANEIESLMRGFEKNNYSLSSGNLFRFSLCDFGGGYIFSASWHHIIMDGRSAKIFFSELAGLYKQLKKCTKADHAIELMGDRRNHVAELVANEGMGVNQFDLAERYWIDRMRGASLYVQLFPHTSKSYGQEESNERLTRVVHALSADDAARFNSRLKELSVTPFQFMASILFLLIHRYTGTKDISIGYVVDLRNEQTKNHVGCCINRIPLRVILDTNAKFIELLNLVKRQRISDRQFQAYPASKILSNIRGEDNLLQDMMNICLSEITSVSNRFDIGDVESSSIPALSGVARSDFLIMFDSAESVRIEFEIDNRKFGKDQIDQLIHSFQIALRSVISDPYKSLSEIPLITDKQRQQILSNWTPSNENRIDFNSSLHKLVFDSAINFPSKIAFLSQNEKISYSQLDNITTYLAQIIKKNMLAEFNAINLFDRVVGIYASEGPETVIAMLAILKAGACFVYIDPAYPLDRKRYVLEDSAVNMILAQEEYFDFVSQKFEGKSCILIQKRHSNFVLSEAAIDKVDYNLIESSRLAYIIYTSGTSGVPKGVMIEHRSIVNYIVWMSKKFEFTSSDYVLQKTTFNFDASILEIFVALSSGATLVFAEKSREKDILYLISCMEKFRITAVQFTPSVLDVFLKLVEDNCMHNSIDTLRVVFSGGESLSSVLIDRFYAISGARLVNLYGPTETTIAVTYCDYDMIGNRSMKNGASCIGRPISNTKCYILDVHKDVVPPGVVGMLYVAGVAVGRGVIGKNENGNFNAELYLPTNKLNCESDRVYKTGDLASWDYDGRIYYHGRDDDQIKIRGRRISTLEIDSLIMSVDGVDRSATMAVVRNQRDYLVSFVAIKRNIEEEYIKEVLCARLRRSLPDFMMPDYTQFLDNFPLNKNGKTEMAKLDAMFEFNLDQEVVLPRNQIEFDLLRCMKVVLNHNIVGVTSDFFKVGGNSLLAVEYISMLNRELIFKFTFNDLIELRSVENLALSASQNSQDSQELRKGGAVIRLSEVRRGKNILCIHPAGGTAFCYVTLAEYLSAEYTIYAIQIPEIERKKFSFTSMSELAQHYISLCEKIDLSLGVTILGWSLGGVIAQEMAVQLEGLGVMVDKVILLDSSAPILRTQNSVFKISRDDYLKKLIKFKGVYKGITEDVIDGLYLVYNGLTALFKQHLAKRCACDLVLIRSSESTGAHEWDRFTSANIYVLTIPVDHWQFMTHPYVRLVSESIINLKN